MTNTSKNAIIRSTRGDTMVKANNHIHSNFSWDCKMDLDKIVKTLRESNIKYGTITDHIEFPSEAMPYIFTKFKIRNLELGRINKIENGNIVLLNGVEISEPHLYKEKISDLSSLGLDVIYGSIHHFFTRAQTESDMKLAYRQYYKEVLKMIEIGQIDVVAHLDYINRYYDRDYSDINQVKEILQAIIENNMALEINTSAKRRTIHNITKYDIFPTIDKLEMYFDLGGEKIVIGSDAHAVNELTDNLDIVENYPVLKEKKIGIYKQRKFEII